VEGKIFTLGTGNKTLEEFLEILKHFTIETAVDVHRFPTSKFAHFKKSHLSKALQIESIEYLYMGNELGGYGKETYTEYMKSDEYKRGINMI